MEYFAVLSNADGDLDHFGKDLCFFPSAEKALWNRLRLGARELLRLHLSSVHVNTCPVFGGV